MQTKERRKNPWRLPRIVKNRDWKPTDWRIVERGEGLYGPTYAVLNKRTGDRFLYQSDYTGPWLAGIPEDASKKPPEYVRDAVDKQRQADALREIIGRHDRVYTVLRHVSSSGMTRHIDLYILGKDRPLWITPAVRNLLGYREANDGSLVVGGCGMDMGFAVVYDLSRVLYGNGYALSHSWL